MAAYTTIDDPSLFHDTLIWTGDGATSRDITGLNFQPDWIWFKRRNATGHNRLIDSVRGSNKLLSSDLGNTEGTDATYVTSFNSDGFSIGNNTDINNNGTTVVSWNWKTGTAISSTNTTGSGTAKTYSGSVNTTSGFSIIKYVGNGTAGHTIPHHLGVAPDFIMVAQLDNTEAWQLYLSPMAASKFIQMNVDEEFNQSSYNMFNSTAPSSTVITLGDQNHTNTNDQNYIVYSFAAKQGYSKIGEYVGLNSTNGNFVYTGFRPSIIFIKRKDADGDWRIYDNKRDGRNNKNDYLEPNTADAESDTDSGSNWDFLANGFKFSGATDAEIQGSGTYLYMAFAHSPLVNSNGIPNNAR